MVRHTHTHTHTPPPPKRRQPQNKTGTGIGNMQAHTHRYARNKKQNKKIVGTRWDRGVAIFCAMGAQVTVVTVTVTVSDAVRYKTPA